MEVSSENYLLLLGFIKLIAFASVAYIILKISKNHCFDKSMYYYRIYFILAFVLTFLNTVSELLGLEKSLNLLLLVYFATSMILLPAISERYRDKFSTFATILLAYLLGSIYFEFTSIQELTIHALGSILLYALLFVSSYKKAKQLNNIGFYILASAFLLIIIFSFIQLIYLYKNNLEYGYTLAVSSANSAFILVIIGFLTQIMMSEYNVLNSFALTDPLTGMNNRRGLYNLLESIIPSSNRDKKCCSVITMDIDFFKKVNDTYGHDGGDIVLKEFSSMIKNSHRNTDISARLGGEEFIVVLPNTDKKTSLIVAEKLRSNTEKLAIKIDDKTINITSSFGVDTSCDELNIDELFKNADKALYQSKFTGRNRVIHYNDNCIQSNADDIDVDLSGHLLIVEDNKTNQMLISFLLNDAGLTYKVVGNGQEAIDICSKENFDLILMDENMPIMKGTQATKVIREQFNSNIPILGLSGEHDISKKFIESGANDFIHKPIDNKLFYEILSSYLKNIDEKT